VTELLERRIDDTLARDGRATCQLAVALMAWDPTAREKIDFVYERALERSAEMRCAPVLAIDRFRLGDRSALDRYAEWISLPALLLDDAFAEPLWRYADDPVVAKANQRIFTALRFFAGSDSTTGLLSGALPKLLRVRPFRQALVSALDDQREIGTAIANDCGGTVSYDDGSSYGWASCGYAGTPPPMVVTRLRVCDVVAWKFWDASAPPYGVTWSLHRRNKAINALKAFLSAPDR
jgi:hypothetical protein